METQDQILIYSSGDGKTQVSVQLKGKNIWLTQRQMGELFDKDTDTIGLHLKNIYQSGELQREATTEKYSVVQIEGDRQIKRKLLHYNLDTIISVGYRVNSVRGTQFRIWANNVLKDYLLQGYVVNEKLLQERTLQLQELKKVVHLQEKVISEHQLNTDESTGLIKIIAQYSRALDLLDDYDHQRLDLPEEGSKEVFQINYSEAKKAIYELGNQTKFEGLFGREKDDSFKGSLHNIYQTFAGQDLYATIEEKWKEKYPYAVQSWQRNWEELTVMHSKNRSIWH